MVIPDFFLILPFAQAAAPGGGIGQFLPIILLFVGMWFLIIAPQRKRQKAHEEMLTKLKKGDKIVTTGGLHATIIRVKEDCFIAEIAENTKVELGKGFISTKLEATTK